jgi:hypothetical protein
MIPLTPKDRPKDPPRCWARHDLIGDEASEPPEKGFEHFVNSST